jgi:hypothetical protein
MKSKKSGSYSFSPFKHYGVVSQHDVGICETYACNMDEQSLNRSNNLEQRLEQFFDANAPHYKSRIPVIIDAYREWPVLLFGDLDHNYNTDYSTDTEKTAWAKEDLDRKHLRVQVAQDYIYCALSKQDYIHPKEMRKYSEAKLGTSKSAMPSKGCKHKQKSRSRVVAGRIAIAVNGRACSIKRRVCSLAPMSQKKTLSPPTISRVANRP